MGKNKLKKFAENETFENLFQPSFEDVFRKDHEIKGKWLENYFKNDNPIVLELGCGKGEYAVNMARMFPNKNFIGIDIKGARLWKGAKDALRDNMKNVAFVRTRIENINSFFMPNEVSEIWITFPDPQPRSSRAKKRLTSSKFLSYYQQVAKSNCLIHLKTDSQALHEYTKALIELNNLEMGTCTNNLYNDVTEDPILSIKTFYESMFLEQGKPITYIRFRLDNSKQLKEPTLD
ncbi:MAG: tRNA (guanosine(46)-N7)-methyltransferase TrmB [Bacteroidales bacterium]